MKKRASPAGYKAAIDWIAYNDDTSFLDDEDGHPSVTLHLVADIYDRTTEEAVNDLRKAVAKRNAT